MPSTRSVPVTILTGFLGAGKTTLLNRFLNGTHGLRVAVLVNDFGSVNVDAQLVVGVESGMISLANGCICCTIRDELVGAIAQVLGSDPPPDHIVVEASGVSDPGPITATFGFGGFRDQTHLDAIICVVDAEQFFAYPEQQALKTTQIALSDLVLLNKAALVDGAARQAIRDWIHRYAATARIIETNYCEVPMEVLLDRQPVSGGVPLRLELAHTVATACGCDGPGCSHPGHHHHDHGDQFATWCFESDRRLSFSALRALAQGLPEWVYRAKGVFCSDQQPERRGILQVVGRREELRWGEPWGKERPHNRIVAIGNPERFDAERLQRLFEGCAAEE